MVGWRLIGSSSLDFGGLRSSSLAKGKLHLSLYTPLEQAPLALYHLVLKDSLYSLRNLYLLPKDVVTLEVVPHIALALDCALRKLYNADT